MKKTKLIISLLVAAIFVFVGLKYFDSQKEGVDEVKDIPKIIISNSYTAEKVAGADPETFVILDNYLEKDKNNVYLGDKIVQDADPATFQIIDGMYSKDKNNVFAYSCLAEGNPGCIVVLKGADVKTFTTIAGSLAKDSSFVYYLGKILKDADPMTITIAGEEKYKGGNSEISYLKDKSYVWRVYAQSNAEVLPNADPATFNPLSWYYSKDAKNVYFYEYPVLDADAATFELLEQIYYGKDKKNVYYHDKIIINADPKTFVSIVGEYFKDSTSVYKEGVKVPDTDPSTFKVLGSFTINKNIVYFRELKMPNADATTFVTLSENYAKDKNFVYFKNRKVLGADPETFRAVTYVGLDKNHYYEFDKVLNSPSESQYGGWQDLGVEVSR